MQMVAFLLGKIENGHERMSSLEIAELSGKPHNDVMKAIRRMEIAWQKVQGGNFSLSSRTYELREQTTLAHMLTNKLEFIKQLMTDPPRPLGTPPVMEGELARRRRQLMAIHPDADPNDIEFELALDRDVLRTKGEEK